MSDFDSFSKAIQKKFYRTKEKVLETFGKADKTKDGDFDCLAATFHEQHATANKLLKAYRTYSAQLKGMSIASRAMFQAMNEAYEPTWGGSESFLGQTEQLNKIWDDHFAKISETIQFQVVSYVGRFPELKNKVAKRGRKLLDYDRVRHKLDALEKSKKRDDQKIATATRELNAAQTIYETINNELFEEIPVLYNSRIPTLTNYFSAFLRSEASFDEESYKIKRQMADLMINLSKDQNLICSAAAQGNLGTLRAKTLPRREASSLAGSSGMKGQYSSQGGAMGMQTRSLDKSATLPPKPPSPKISPFSYQPPPPQEPAPVPPSSPPSHLYSMVGPSKMAATRSANPPQKPPQPLFSSPSTQNSPPKLPPQPRLNTPPPVPPPPALHSTDQQHFNMTTQNIISYIPELKPSASESKNPSQPKQGDLVPGNPFEVDVKVEHDSNKVQSGGKVQGTAEVKTAAGNISGGVVEVGKNVGESANECGQSAMKAGANKVETAVGGAAQQASDAGRAIAVKAESVVNSVYQNVATEMGKAKESASEAGKTIVENISVATNKVAEAGKNVVDGVGKSSASVGAGGGSVSTSTSTKVGHTINITPPTGSFKYRVEATHNYAASDADEISLESGDVIFVLPINNKEFEDEGWALGLKQKDGSRGMFPINFTRKID